MGPITRSAVVAALLIALAPSLRAPLLAEPTLEARLRPLIDAHDGSVAVAVRHLDTGETFFWRERETMPTASLIKLAVMITAYRLAEKGEVALDEMLTLREEDKVPGSGILTTHFSAGARISLRDAVRLMIAYSDNTATNLVLDRIGLEATAKHMEELGCPETRVHSKVYSRESSIFPERSAKYGLGSTTAAETLTLLERLHRRELAGTEASEAMLGHLLACQDRSKIPRFLPAGVEVAHKTGAVSRVRCDAGIIHSPAGPIAICVVTSENEDRRWAEDNAADLLCAEIARAAYEHFDPRPRAEEPDGDGRLAKGASGVLVEHLQRTLNARLEPSPDLAVDGDFGPITEAAVVRFQRSREIEPNGVVGPETWAALGTLVTSDPPVPDPEVVNAEALAREPPDPLAGPPWVTCRAWAAADARTGEIVGGDDLDRTLAMASTTKIMTAHLVLRLADKDPAALAEEVVFSRRADETPGSSARLVAGERVPVGELLYGLLLPSGNDAAVALAEHLGGRFADAAPEAEDPLDRFVAEMNRVARQLGLASTRFANPHGLPAKEHHSSARDLVALARAALADPRFRGYVAARQRGCRVVAPGGATRNVLWKNTNRLLPIEGYGGVKTGTTEEAGACLVSLGRRGEDELIVVVLGSASSAARYADTRNIFRWAWRQMGHGEQRDQE